MGFISSSSLRTAINIACDKDGNVLYDERIAKRAKQMIGRQRDCHFLLDNCHQFISGCITGKFQNSDNYFWMVCYTIKMELNNGNSIEWLVWDR